MGIYKYIRENWNKRDTTHSTIWRSRFIEWAKTDATVRIEHPTRLDRARSLGYKAKPGFIIVRQRVARNKRDRPQIRKGRRSKHYGQRLNLDKSFQVVCEQRAQKKYPNCEVLNSYYLAQNGSFYWYEVILIDRAHPQILSNPIYSLVSTQKGRVNRGLTSAARKSRGLRGKGTGFEKMRPSKTANRNRRKE